MGITSFEKNLGLICYLVASASLLALLWAYQLGRIGVVVCIGSAAFFGQWGWNLRHQDPDARDELIDWLRK